MNIIRIALATVVLSFSFGLTSCSKAPEDAAPAAEEAPAAEAPAAEAPAAEAPAAPAPQ